MSKPVEFVTGPKESGDTATIESVADILERELQSVIVDWLARVEQEPDLKCIPLSFEERTGHLPRLLHDVIARLASGRRDESSDFESRGRTRGFAA